MSKRAPHVVIGVTGSIAAYKAAELVRLMVRKGWEVSVVMTPAAARFVAPLTFQTLSRNPVICDMFAGAADWKPDHIAVADRADALVVAPCSADALARLANGFADDMVCCTALAAACPLVIAPAMNDRMWLHPATQANVDTLRRRGAKIVDVEAGDLACGTAGKGRMAAVETVLSAVERALCGGRKGKR